MHSKLTRSALSIGIAAALAAITAVAHAQTASPKVVITNLTPNVELPLVTSSAVEIDANGDMRVQCRVDGAGKCPGLGSDGGGSGGSNPPANVSLTTSSNNITAGQSITLNWNSGTGTEACYGAGPSGIGNWSGAVLAPSGNRSLTLSTAGSYTFQVRCFNATGSTTVSSPTVTVAPSTTPPPSGDYCAEVYGSNPPTSPNFTAFGFQKVEKPFAEIWGVTPGTAAQKRGVPGTFTNPAQGKYLAIPFVMPSGAQMRMSFLEAQPLGGEDPPTNSIQSGRISYSISPCPGDFRPRVNGSSDPFLSGACRMNASSLTGNPAVTTVEGTSGCLVPAGRTVYLNISAHEMYGTSAPTSTTCPSAPTCGVSMLLQ